MTTKIIRRATLLALSGTAIMATSIASANLSKQFSSCAAEAIASKKLSAKKFSVTLPTQDLKLMDHDSSAITSEYIMQLTNPASGESLGRISCRVNTKGYVQSVKYLNQK